MADKGFNHDRPDESISELVGRLTQEVSDLVNTHLQLARVEIMSDLRPAGRGAGMLGGAGIAGYVAAFLAMSPPPSVWGSCCRSGPGF